jgi:hypothetical protein
MNQTVYTLQVDSISACFEIKINDVPLYNERKGNPTKTEIPISHLLVQGNNQIKIIIYPAKHEIEFQDHSKTEFQIYCRDIKDLREKRKLFAQVDFPDYKTDKSLKTSVIPATQEFNVELPFSPPLWASSPVLTLNTEIIQEATKIYRTYFDFLKQQDIKSLLKLTNIKDSDYSKSYFMSLAQQQDRIRDSISGIFEDSDFKIVDFDKQTISPSIHGFGKIMTLTNKDNRSPLQFYNKEEGITTSYLIYLSRINNKMEIVL